MFALDDDSSTSSTRTGEAVLSLGKRRIEHLGTKCRGDLAAM